MSTLGGQQRSRISQQTQKVLEEVAHKTSSRIDSMQGPFNDEEARVVWNGLGLYLNRNLRMGRGVVVPKLGVFTFTAPQLNLSGVTNPQDRNLLPRHPVFIVAKDFVPGKMFTPGIYFHAEFGKGARPFAVHGVNGEVPQTRLSLSEVASYSNMDKSKVEHVIRRVLKQLAQAAIERSSFDMEIPSVGVLRLRKGIIAVAFNEFIVRDTKEVLNKSIQQKKKRGEMLLTKDNLMRLAHHENLKHSMSSDKLALDEGAKRFLSSEMGIFFNPDGVDRRTITHFDRTVSTKPFNNSFQMSRSLPKMGLTNSTSFYNTKTGLDSVFGSTKRHTRLQYNFAFNQLRGWARSKGLSSVESFQEFCRHALTSPRAKPMLTLDDLWRGVKCVCGEVTQQQCTQLFRILDYDKDGVVTLGDWQEVINQSGNKLLTRLIQVANQMHPQEFFSAFRQKEGKTRYSLLQLKDGIYQVLKAPEDQCMQLARLLTQGSDYITVDDIKTKLSIYEEHVKAIRGLPLDDMLLRLQHHLAASGSDLNSFAKDIEELDSDGSGRIEQNALMRLFQKLKFKLSVSQKVNLINSLSPSQGKVSYRPLLDKLEKETKFKGKEGRPQFFTAIHKYLGANPKVAVPITLAGMAALVQPQLPGYSLFQLQEECKLLDIDGDGVISGPDLQTFVGRKRYMELGRDSGEARRSLFPRKGGEGETVDKLLAQIKQSIARKNYSLFDFFNFINTDKDGMLTIGELSAGLDRFVKFDQAQKDLVFAHLDRQGQGVIPYKTFLQIMSGKKEETLGGTFEWAEATVKRIREWYRASTKTPEEAFKLVDRDFDGLASDQDLLHFLTRYIGFYANDVSHVRLARLKKLIDTYKRNMLDVTDFIRLFSGGGNNLQSVVTGGAKADQTSWLTSARQQIGLVISRNFKNTVVAFNQIAKNQKLLTLAAFSDFVDKNKTLLGFFENGKMLQKIFTELDHHKKGYLTELDFVNAFGAFDWEEQMVKEVVDKVRCNFKRGEDAFAYFANGQPSIDQKQFRKTIENLIQYRFTEEDVSLIWKKLAGSKGQLGREAFQQIFQVRREQPQRELQRQYPRDKWSYSHFDVIRGTVPRTVENEYTQTEKIGDICDKMLKQVKEIVRASPFSLEEAFTAADQSGRGSLTNLQFRKAFRSLGIGLTSKEIDILLNYCDFREGSLIPWRTFLAKFQLEYLSKYQDRLWERAELKLKQFSDLLYNYMISPSEAFRQYNRKRTGFMGFGEFRQLVQDLFAKAQRPLPSHSIIHGLFDEIDVRKDGTIDAQELVETFKFFSPPMSINGRGQNAEEKRLSPVDSLEAEHRLVKLIGRNRKFLLREWEELAGQSPKLGSKAVLDSIKALCERAGVKLADGDVAHQVHFAQKDGTVDFRLLLDTFKQRLQRFEQFPKVKAF